MKTYTDIISTGLIKLKDESILNISTIDIFSTNERFIGSIEYKSKVTKIVWDENGYTNIKGYNFIDLGFDKLLDESNFDYICSDMREDFGSGYFYGHND